jgi:hypothetical protein
LLETCFNYPSLTELYKAAAADALNALNTQSIRNAA